MDWISVEDELPEEGERVLCLFNGEPIVLELGRETPTHEESFKSFFFWTEPYDEILLPEWDDVTNWVRIKMPLPKE
tara:strand:+ start:257 stop:484 length:228 start_codon:yes stop_codon:yes gene_type:complete